jgi:hypothetical protein
MNDVEKAFAYQDEDLKVKRDMANKHLPKLAALIANMPEPDIEFTRFIQYMVDDYMLNVCKLGRRH